MAVYFITGKLGSGKTLITIGKIKEYLRKGKKVATNLDLNIEQLVKKTNKTPFYRLPDKPRPEDLKNIGLGSDDVEESTFGLIVLDECGTWLNARGWNDKERKLFIDWMLHARKYGWDILFIIQDIELIDRQIKISLCEHLVICRRLDRLRIPVVSHVVKFLTGHRVTMPKIHTAKVFYGESESAVVADRWTYRGKDLYAAYDTRQVFKDDMQTYNNQEYDMRALYSGLSHWHLVGRYDKSIKYPIPRNLFEVLIYPTWQIITFLKSLDPAAARRSGVGS